MRRIERLRRDVKKALARGCSGQNYLRQLTLDEAQGLVEEFDKLNSGDTLVKTKEAHHGPERARNSTPSQPRD